MSCFDRESRQAEGPAALSANPFETMLPRVPGRTPVERRNGASVKSSGSQPEGVYLPNNNVMTPNMRSPVASRSATWPIAVATSSFWLYVT